MHWSLERTSLVLVAIDALHWCSGKAGGLPSRKQIKEWVLSKQGAQLEHGAIIITSAGHEWQTKVCMEATNESLSLAAHVERIAVCP